MKYIIIGYSNPNIQTFKADIRILCKNDSAIWWSNNADDSYWLFDTRKQAEEYMQLFSLSNCITYGIYV